ncbi:hypothetical protein [Arthrobacter sp. Leaf234]|uniref:hypothetical protein n=1 Tax=Arthrobacter sp. Leaf234 TaxID=1736303 RepID=UPI0012FB2DB5|nr:hypothetical protein [Arthrobacter sp. Leaf234]
MGTSPMTTSSIGSTSAVIVPPKYSCETAIPDPTRLCCRKVMLVPVNAVLKPKTFSIASMASSRSEVSTSTRSTLILQQCPCPRASVHLPRRSCIRPGWGG